MARDPFRDRWRRTQETERRAPKLDRAQPPLEALARRLGMRIEAFDPLTSTLAATKQGVTVRIEPSPILQNDWSITVGAPGLSPRARMSPEGRLSTLAKAVGGNDVLVGDRDFDAAVHVRGPFHEVLAMLDHTARSGLRNLAARGFELRDGTLSLTRPRRAADSADRWLEDDVARALAVVKHLASGEPVEVRLAERVATDASMAHRARCLEALGACAPHVVRTLAEGGRLARWPALRLGACLFADHHDDALFRACAVDPAIDPTSRALVLAKLAKHHAARDLVPLADQVMRDATPYVEEAALRILRSAIEHESKVIDILSEPALLGLLRDADGAEELVIVARLGEVGTTAAMEALLPRTSGLFVRTSLKQAARAAITAIERRLGHDRGGLSLTAPVGGELSVAAQRDGAISMTKPSASGARTPTEDE